MARAISDEEQQLKKRARRRLIGAVVLVAAIVVVLPMVLDSEPKPSGQQVSVQIPSPDSGAFTPKAVPLTASPELKTPPPPPAEAKSSPVATPLAPATSPAVNSPADTSETAKPADKSAKPAETAASKPAEAGTQKPPLKKAESTAKSRNGRYVVQVIALADAGKAKQMQEQIAGAGIKSYTEVVKTSKGDVTRVRAGPFATRKAAERARDQLKKIGMSGNVTAR
jgi:DedD protein